MICATICIFFRLNDCEVIWNVVVVAVVVVLWEKSLQFWGSVNHAPLLIWALALYTHRTKLTAPLESRGQRRPRTYRAACSKMSDREGPSKWMFLTCTSLSSYSILSRLQLARPPASCYINSRDLTEHASTRRVLVTIFTMWYPKKTEPIDVLTSSCLPAPPKVTPGHTSEHQVC